MKATTASTAQALSTVLVARALRMQTGPSLRWPLAAGVRHRERLAAAAVTVAAAAVVVPVQAPKSTAAAPMIIRAAREPAVARAAVVAVLVRLAVAVVRL